MEKIKYYLEKFKAIISLIVIIILLLITLLILLFNKEEKVETTEIKSLEVSSNEQKEEVTSVKVDIKGYIENPGVYELDNTCRVIDVINKAGGLKENANTEYINLSKKVTDEMIIIIYSNDQIEKFKEIEPEKEIIYIEYECECPDNINDSCITEKDVVNTNGVGSKNDDKDTLISINTGTIEELITLSGIGESKAKSIIKYREENGGFKSLEEIMNVSGIGESAYSKIKDNIKL